MPATATVGRTRAILERLYTWIGVALDADYEEYYVSMDEDYPVEKAKIMPLVTVSLGDAVLMNEVYTRKYPNVGNMAYFPFTLYAYQYMNTEYDVARNKDAQILAGRIIHYLDSRRRNSTEMTTHKINDVFDLRAVESNPRGARRLTRMIITGTIKAIREDAP